MNRLAFDRQCNEYTWALNLALRFLVCLYLCSVNEWASKRKEWWLRHICVIQFTVYFFLHQLFIIYDFWWRSTYILFHFYWILLQHFIEFTSYMRTMLLLLLLQLQELNNSLFFGFSCFIIIITVGLDFIKRSPSLSLSLSQFRHHDSFRHNAETLPANVVNRLKYTCGSVVSHVWRPLVERVVCLYGMSRRWIKTDFLKKKQKNNNRWVAKRAIAHCTSNIDNIKMKIWYMVKLNKMQLSRLKLWRIDRLN